VTTHRDIFLAGAGALEPRAGVEDGVLRSRV